MRRMCDATFAGCYQNRLFESILPYKRDLLSPSFLEHEMKEGAIFRVR